jgi:hypothetical protein
VTFKNTTRFIKYGLQRIFSTTKCVKGITKR